MNGKLIKACECASVQKEGSAFTKPSDKWKSKGKRQDECATVQECVADIIESLFAQL